MIVPFKLENKKFIFIDLDTRKRVFHELEFDFINHSENNFFKVRKNNKFGLVNNNGEILIPIIYDNIFGINDGFAVVALNHKLGIVNTNGKLIIPIEYNILSHVSNGLILFSNSEEIPYDDYVNTEILFGFLDTNNNIKIPPQYTLAKDFSENLAVVGKSIGLDENYEEIIKYGYINTEGKIFIDFQFDFAKSFENGFANVKIANEEFCIDSVGKKLNKITIENTDKLNYPIKFENKKYINNSVIIKSYGYKSDSGQIVISPIYTEANDFKNGLALVSINNDYFYILPTGEELYNRIEYVG